MINGRWTSNARMVKMEAQPFFQNKFKEQWVSRRKLSSPHFKTLSTMEAIKLEAPFSPEEVKVAVWACGSEKIPGPDGFTFKFIKTYFDIIKHAVMKFISHFDEMVQLLEVEIHHSSLITLAPKVKDPSSLSDYLHISLIGCMYKIISKILAIRLKSVIGSVISDVNLHM